MAKPAAAEKFAVARSSRVDRHDTPGKAGIGVPEGSMGGKGNSGLNVTQGQKPKGAEQYEGWRDPGRDGRQGKTETEILEGQNMARR